MGDTPTLDRSMLERLQEWGGDDLKLKMIELFMESGQERLDGVRGGLERQDWELAERSAHSLKSAAANLGAERLRGTAGRLEELLEGGRRDDAAELVGRLEREFAEAVDALSKEQE